jgi:hypothetical protein
MSVTTSVTMGGTMKPENGAQSGLMGPLSIEREGQLQRESDQPHNAGVVGSSPTPAIGKSLEESDLHAGAPSPSEGAAPWAALSPSEIVERPPLGARVRVLPGTGIPGVVGRVGIVEDYHVDGVAIVLRLSLGGVIVVESSDVEIDRGAPEYVPSSDAQPARVAVAP